MTRADHELVAVEVKLLDGNREQWQVLAIQFAREWQPLDDRAPDLAALDNRRGGPRQMYQGKEIRGREHLAEHLERLLTATHAGEPVMDEGYAQDSIMTLKA
jgi:hypothetical protein